MTTFCATVHRPPPLGGKGERGRVPQRPWEYAYMEGKNLLIKYANMGFFFIFFFPDSNKILW